MEETGITYQKYEFTWRNVPCEARDGRIFINNQCVEELTDVNRSSQSGDLFFVEGRDVTDICAKYLPGDETNKEDRETESLKERMVTATGESLAGKSRARASVDTDLENEKKGEPERGLFGFGTKRGRSSVRQQGKRA